jgi:hypothetical protein
LSLPIPPIPGTITAALTAARVAASAAGHVASAAGKVANLVADQASETLGFDAILQQTPDVKADTKAPATLDELKKQFVDAAQKTLSALGIAANQSVPLNVDQSGHIEVRGNDPRAAQIEEALAGAPLLSELARRILASSPMSQTTIELPPAGQVYI